MKLSKALLGAILVGIVMQTTTSCSKEKELTDSQAKKEAKEKEKSNPDNCPACGMG